MAEKLVLRDDRLLNKQLVYAQVMYQQQERNDVHEVEFGGIFNHVILTRKAEDRQEHGEGQQVGL
jgi:hypothetical protein